ncbi:MAG: molybdopterin synthase sulfur carrier subunit [Sulfitobacter sp.]|jgi:molybdopterin synthase sulfur carrier subunit
MKLDVLYFAWLRERIGLGREQIETDAATVAELVAELRAREDRYDLAFSDMASVRVAIDQDLTDLSASLECAREIAFFPPMTGG